MRSEAALAWQAAESTDSSPDGVVHFELGGRRLGLTTLDIYEILSRVPAVTVPAAPGPVRGLMMLRGKVVTLLDAAALLGLEQPAETDESVLVLAEPWDHVGLTVPGRLGLAEVTAASTGATPSECDEMSGLVRETVALEDEQLVHVLDPLAVIRAVERIVGAGGR